MGGVVMGDMGDTYKTASQEAIDKRHAQAVASFRAKAEQRKASIQHTPNREERRLSARKAAK